MLEQHLSVIIIGRTDFRSLQIIVIIISKDKLSKNNLDLLNFPRKVRFGEI